MEYVQLGQTEMEVSRIAHGLWNVVDDINWDGTDEDRAIESIHTAVEEGINFFDTAEAYGDGYSEEILGTALDSVDRDEVVVATKAKAGNLGYEDLKASCRASLDRMNLDYVDVYYLHYPNHEIPFSETARALRELQEEGLIRIPAVSNFGPRDIDEMLEECRVEANQVPYNLLWRAVEYDITAVCQSNDIDVVCYSPLAQGLLAGQYGSADEVPEGKARTRHFSSDRPRARHSEEGAEEETFQTIKKFENICDEYDMDYVEGALTWILSRDSVASVIVGTTNPDHVRANAEIPHLDPPAGFIDELTNATENLKEELGPNPDYWQSNSRYR